MSYRRDRIVISAFSSGAGKTFCTSVIAALLRNAGHSVQVFKYSADFVDAHISACADGRPTKNISYWMLGQQGLIQGFLSQSTERDIALVEGGAGIVDGNIENSMNGSTAHFALLTDTPIILVCDVGISPQTTLLMIDGLRHQIPRLRVAGILCNMVRDIDAHFRRWERIVGKHSRIPFLGYLPHRDEWIIDGSFYPLLAPDYDRHIGGMIRSASVVAQKTIDIRAIKRICRSAPPLPYRRTPDRLISRDIRIAVAGGMAFYPLFPENVDLLKRHGAETVSFCPMIDTALPRDIDGIYISGRFPEPFGAELEENAVMRKDVARAAALGMPIYAEGGGLKYLAETMIDDSGNMFHMASVIPAKTSISRRRGFYGLVRIDAVAETAYMRKGTTAKGYLLPHGDVRYRGSHPIMRLTDAVFGNVSQDGYSRGNIFATIAHINWMTLPTLGKSFIRLCRRYRSSRLALNNE